MGFNDNTHPAVVSIPHIYRSTFRNYHAQFWDEVNRGLLFDLTDEPVNIDKYYRINGFFSMDWLGVYVYGAPCVGKSLSPYDDVIKVQNICPCQKRIQNCILF